MDRHVATQNDLDALADGESRESYADYLDHLVINSSPRPRRLADVIEPWQQQRERRRLASLEDVAGVREGNPRVRWFWEGAAKGNDKSSGVGRRLNWLLAYARRPLSIYICSGKEDQAALITAAMKAELELNPWLKKRVTVSDYTGSGSSGSSLHVMPMKAATGQGIFPDVLIADELTHWEHEEGRKFWDFVLASVTKRRGAHFEVLTNAGYIGSWQWEARKTAASNPSHWDFFEQPPYSTLASWMDESAIAVASLGMFDGEVRRLFRNVWIDPGEERGFLTEADGNACVDRALWEKTHGTAGIQYFAVVDYGTGVAVRKRDRSALTVMHAVPGSEDVIIDRLDCWQDQTGERIPLHVPEDDPSKRSIQQWCDITLKHFPKTTLVFDPYQCESLAQVYERRGRRVERFEYAAGKKNMRMALLLQQMVRNRRLHWSPLAGLLTGEEDDTFAKEMSRLVLKKMSYGHRFDHESGRHDDRAAAVGMGLIYLVPETPPPSMMPSSVPKEVVERHTSSPAPTVRRDWAAARNLFGMGNQNRPR